MIYNVHGPMFEQLDQAPWPADADIVIVRDHFEPKLLKKFLQQTPPQHCLQSFYVRSIEDLEQLTWVPIFLKQISEQMSRCAMTEQPQTLGCFGFMIFKNRDMRTLAMESIEAAGLQSDYYTLYLDPHLQGKYKHQARFYTSRGPYHPTITYENNWADFLQDRVYSPTAVNLIVETLELAWGANITYTEKTAFSVCGLNFPIWLGGYAQADTWTSLGFDSFSDIINHDYQYLTDPAESMRRALEDNRAILTDLNLAKSLRDQAMPRLLANRRLFLSRPFDSMLSNIVEQAYPNCAKEIKRHFRIF
jgi:hypothetical protein